MNALTRRASRGLAIASLWLAGIAHAGTVHYYYTDPQGTVLAKADAQGNIVSSNDYAPYGSAAPNLDAAPNGPGYTGHVNDPDTGLVYMQARYYDPVVGRFLSEDPVGPAAGNPFNFNRFAYANNNPIVNMDPDGKYSCSGKNCKSVNNFVKALNDSLSGLKKGSDAYNKVSRVTNALGKNDGKGIAISTTQLSPGTIADAPSVGKLEIDVNQLTDFAKNFNKQNPGTSESDVLNALGGAALAHETRHTLDYAAFTNGQLPSKRSDELRTEQNAYRTESDVGAGLHINTDTHNESWSPWQTQYVINADAQGSTNRYCEKNACQ